ncbi:thiamine transporter 1-like [Daktulosphaira vitifoliae]|uniref:thiamine transporter 1-like n=1 Tax=Daktulosphaira vitifoliae TaxID=58002 RepID=UPI0021AA0D91|nr:thiamine transporter 1-like [Daktulosphaira vitifoliae]
MNSKCIDQSAAKSSTSHPQNNIEENSPKKIHETEVQKRENVNLKKAFLHLWNDFKQSYSDPYVVKLCFWWALAFGAYVQVYTYINVLYTYVLNLNNDGDFTLYNGAAESLNTLIGTTSLFFKSKSEVAKRLGKDSYGLVFGFNSFIALFLHTLMTYGMVQGHIISVTVAQQR